MTLDANYQMFLNRLPFACIQVNQDFQIEFINTEMTKILRLSEPEMLSGHLIGEIIFENDRKAFYSYAAGINSENTTKRWNPIRLIDLKHSVTNLLMNVSDFGQSGVYLFCGIPISNEDRQALDTSGQKYQIFDQASLTNYQTICEKAIVGIGILTEKGFLSEGNPALAEHFCINKSEVIGQHYSVLMPKPSQERFNILFDSIKSVEQDYVKDVITIEDENNGNRILELSLAKIDQYDQGKQYFMLISEDITHLEDTHAALLQSEKLALTGRLAASLAHEINNPLQTSLGCLGLVEEMLNEDDQGLEIYIKMAIEELQRSARIVKRLRDLNRRSDVTERTAVDMREIIEGVLVLTQNQLSDNNIKPVFTYHGAPPIVRVSNDQIQQVILNLVMNAIDALPNGGNIFFDINSAEGPRGVSIRIRDTGKGIDNKFKTNIFDPFFTTKDDGLGLGLYICKQIIEDHNGSLEFTSEQGLGTEFSIWLPDLEIFDGLEK